MEVGRVWVEVFLPFDPAAYVSFLELAEALGGGETGIAAAAKADPALAERALAPIDSQGEAMTAPELQELADLFLLESRKMDAKHDYQARSSLKVVGSFINDEHVASPKFWPGAWVIVFTADPVSVEFKGIENGDYNAVSFNASVIKRPVVANVGTQEAA